MITLCCVFSLQELQYFYRDILYVYRCINLFFFEPMIVQVQDLFKDVHNAMF